MQQLSTEYPLSTGAHFKVCIFWKNEEDLWFPISQIVCIYSHVVQSYKTNCKWCIFVPADDSKREKKYESNWKIGLYCVKVEKKAEGLVTKNQKHNWVLLKSDAKQWLPSRFSSEKQKGKKIFWVFF